MDTSILYLCPVTVKPREARVSSLLVLGRARLPPSRVRPARREPRPPKPDHYRGVIVLHPEGVGVLSPGASAAPPRGCVPTPHLSGIIFPRRGPVCRSSSAPITPH